MPIRYILYNLALMSFIGMPYAVLMPVFAKDILKGGPETLGFLMASSGLGAIAGALFLASRKTVLGLGRLIVLGSIMFGTGLICFAMSTSVLLSAALLTFTGFGMMVQMVASNTIIQTIVDDDDEGAGHELFCHVICRHHAFRQPLCRIAGLFHRGPMDTHHQRHRLYCSGIIILQKAQTHA